METGRGKNSATNVCEINTRSEREQIKNQKKKNYLYHTKYYIIRLSGVDRDGNVRGSVTIITILLSWPIYRLVRTIGAHRFAGRSNDSVGDGDGPIIVTRRTLRDRDRFGPRGRNEGRRNFFFENYMYNNIR